MRNEEDVKSVEILTSSVTLNTCPIVSFSQLEKSRCAGDAGGRFLGAAGVIAGVASAGRFCRGCGVGFCLGSGVAGGGVDEVDAGGVGVTDCNFARRFKRIYRLSSAS